MKVTDKIEITNEDNMLLMARYPDNYFDLAIVDPPYGINYSGRDGQKTIKYEYNKIHPTQKPVALYKWLLDKYAQQGNKILDTHLGSGSIAIACHDYGFELTACELDLEYYEKAVERINNHVAQLKLF